MRDRLQDMLDKHNLEHIRESLLREVEPYLNIDFVNVPNEGIIPIGSSKAGGYPDLPPDITPSAPFVAQINLEQLEAFELPVPMPDNGFLNFFEDGLIPYNGTREELVRRDDLEAVYRPALLRITQGWLIPDADWVRVTFKPGSQFMVEYNILEMESFVISGIHRLFGMPDIVHDDPCQEDSRLLLQLDNDPEFGLNLGVDGTVYWCIEESALREWHFEEATCIMQSL
jgi:uncharacterized protein YwqG